MKDINKLIEGLPNYYEDVTSLNLDIDLYHFDKFRQFENYLQYLKDEIAMYEDSFQRYLKSIEDQNRYFELLNEDYYKIHYQIFGLTFYSEEVKEYFENTLEEVHCYLTNKAFKRYNPEIFA